MHYFIYINPIYLTVSTFSQHLSTLAQKKWTVQKMEEWLFSPTKRFLFFFNFLPQLERLTVLHVLMRNAFFPSHRWFTWT